MSKRTAMILKFLLVAASVPAALFSAEPQPPSGRAKPAAPAKKPLAPSTERPAATADDAQDKQDILNGDRWREAMYWMDHWFSIQEMYDDDEVAKFKANFKAKVANMNAAELDDLLGQLQAKLNIVLSQQAEEARQWLGQFLAVQAMYTPEQLKQMRPKLAKMSAREMREELLKFDNKHQQQRQASASFREAQKYRADVTREERRQQFESQQRARDRAEQSAQNNSNFSSPYAPRGRLPYALPRSGARFVW